MIRNELQDFPLFQATYFGTRWPENVTDLDYLRKAMWFPIIDSFLYVLAVLDLSLSRTEEGFLPEPSLFIYLPQWKNEQWRSPMRAWFDQLKINSESKSLEELAEKLAEWLKLDFDVARREMYKWRKADPVLPWERMLKIVQAAELDDLEALGLIIQYGIAHALHRFHEICIEHGMPSRELAMVYAGYAGWYRHHLKLAKETAPVWRLPDEGGADS
ncbi:hypothetical protein EGM51_09430 [Verrucomicrobia bacterium S94]|nr:hypothetical protein EGM51_09430 [Verrucomicrobia bacterium S94]